MRTASRLRRPRIMRCPSSFCAGPPACFISLITASVARKALMAG
jgi:hypothetical protein